MSSGQGPRIFGQNPGVPKPDQQEHPGQVSDTWPKALFSAYTVHVQYAAPEAGRKTEPDRRSRRPPRTNTPVLPVMRRPSSCWVCDEDATSANGPVMQARPPAVPHLRPSNSDLPSSQPPATTHPGRIGPSRKSIRNTSTVHFEPRPSSPGSRMTAAPGIRAAVPWLLDDLTQADDHFEIRGGQRARSVTL